MAKVAAEAGAPFLAGAAPAVHASPDLPAASAAAWNALRDLPEAALLGLALPAFLLRPPYGSDTSSIERFDFEEFGDVGAKRAYLWGNAAWACAALLAQAFQKQGWAFKPGAALDLTELPMHVAPDEDGDQEATVAAAWVDRRLAEPLGKQGFMCLLGVKGGDALQLARFQSLARPPKDRPFSDLWGPWGQEGAAAPPTGGDAAPALAASVVFEARSIPGAEGRPSCCRGGAAEEGSGGSRPSSGEQTVAEDEAVDADLDALLNELNRPAEEPPAAVAGPATEEGDADLDALLKELGGDVG